jgi:hypothetical protein
MRWLLFLSRLSFICGVCFVLSLSILIEDWIKEEDITRTLITIGFVIGLIVVPITLLCYLAVFIITRKLPVPSWLVVSNILFLFILLFYILFINGNHPSPA